LLTRAPLSVRLEEQMKKTISMVSQLGKEIGDLVTLTGRIGPSYTSYSETPGIAQQPNPMQH
jgi:hypothetical protein